MHTRIRILERDYRLDELANVIFGQCKYSISNTSEMMETIIEELIKLKGEYNGRIQNIIE